MNDMRAWTEQSSSGQAPVASSCELGNERRKQSSGIWHRVEVVLTDVSEERIASIFRVEGKNKKIRF
jgi:hypothetical protein